MSISSFFYTLGAAGLVVLMATRPVVNVGPTAEKTGNTPETTPAATEQHSAVTVPDYAREQRLSAEVRAALFDGEVIDLNDGQRDFMAIQTDAADPKGAVILLHGRGFHPDWADAINPLRTLLPEQGWTTLSLQMPVLEKDAKYYDYVPLFPEADQRIDAGIRHLQDQGVSHIVLLGHSCGGHMAMHWLESRGDAELAAVIGLGLGATDYQQYMTKPFPLDKLLVPVLDLYGEAEYPAVIKMAPERRAMIEKAGNRQSAQMMLPQANHYFTDQGETLTEVVAGWLNGLTL